MKYLEILRNRVFWYHVYLSVLTGVLFRFYQMGTLGFILYVFLSFFFFSVSYAVFLVIRRLFLLAAGKFIERQHLLDGIREDYINNEK